MTKGVILCGGTGSRLMQLTKVLNKHLVRVGSKPMIEYILDTMIKTGIKDVAIVTGVEHVDSIIKYLGNGNQYGLNLCYFVQHKAGGIAEALNLCRSFVGNDNCFVLLGDNYFEHNFSSDVLDFNGGAKVFLKEVPDPKRFGVATIENGQVINIIEKPKEPASNLAVVGAYLYDNTVWGKINICKPSNRGEMEITDVNFLYMQQKSLQYGLVEGFWSDMGTLESLKKCDLHLYGVNLDKSI